MESQKLKKLNVVLAMIAPDFRIMGPVFSSIELDGVEVESIQFSIPGDVANAYCHCFLENEVWHFGRVVNDELFSTELHSRDHLATLLLLKFVGDAICDVVEAGESSSLSSATVSYLFALNTLKSHTSMFGGWGREFRTLAKDLFAQLDDRRIIF